MRYGTDEQKRHWLVPLLDGSIRSCFAMTEPAVSWLTTTGLTLLSLSVCLSVCLSVSLSVCYCCTLSIGVIDWVIWWYDWGCQFHRFYENCRNKRNGIYLIITLTTVMRRGHVISSRDLVSCRFCPDWQRWGQRSQQNREIVCPVISSDQQKKQQKNLCCVCVLVCPAACTCWCMCVCVCRWHRQTPLTLRRQFDEKAMSMSSTHTSGGHQVCACVCLSVCHSVR